MHFMKQMKNVQENENFQKNVTDKKKRINIRKLTPNECRKLQGFPSDWRQVVCDGAAYKQFGNAVTVNVAYKVACKVIEYMNLIVAYEELLQGENSILSYLCREIMFNMIRGDSQSLLYYIMKETICKPPLKKK